MRFWARDVAAATGGTLVGPDVEIDGTAFDSRTISPGQLFVPLIDQRDGHDFIDVAAARGAAAYLTSRPAAGGSAIEVDDTLQALMALAGARRRLSEATVIGITGSVGKTSTKDFAWAALGASRRTWANQQSFNNDQGLPTTILNGPDDTEVMVLEMGMRGFGEIARLCAIASPTIGLVTRVAEAHSDRVGGIDGVARAKAELISALPSDGTAILNGDDDHVRAMASIHPGRCLLVGARSDCDVRIVDLMLDDAAHPACSLATPWGTIEVRLSVAGRHMAWNAAAAIACVGAIGGDVAAGAAAVGDVELTAMRMNVRTAVGGATILDDSYNANPTSMRAALDTLAALPMPRKTAVLGVMAEIVDADAGHRRITAYAQHLGIRVVAFGTDAYGITATTDVIADLGSLDADDAVLVKGSRVAALEDIADDLRNC